MFMEKILDLHIHSPYARACSPRISPDSIARICEIKGLDVIGTGDFTHPDWFTLLNKKLIEVDDSGLYQLRDASSKTLFLLSTEVSLIYKEAGKTRKIHLVVHAPSLAVAKELNQKLTKRFNLKSDGRPILGISAPKFVRFCLNIDSRFLIYPAHIWTPWYSVLGAKSGFDSLEACFQEEMINIHAFETGLSSDPQMNWQLSSLDDLTCLSNSDAHSLENIAREANIMELASLSYANIYRVIKNNLKIVAGDKEGLLGTIEFYPEEGKYYYDGHSQCSFSCSPQESRRIKGICPICHKPLTLGVNHRIMDLADREKSDKAKFSSPFFKLVALDKIIAKSLGVKSRSAQKVVKKYCELINRYGPEIYILKDLELDDLAIEDYKIAIAIKKIRANELKVNPGFDDKYGEINIF